MEANYFLLLSFSILAVGLSIGVIAAKSLVSSTVIAGILSIVSLICYCLMKAPDVAITEAAIGSAISGIIMMLTITIVGKYNNNLEITRHHGVNIITLNLISIICIGLFFIILSTIFFDLPTFGDPYNHVHSELSAHYLNFTKHDFNIPNIVTAILGGYRGFDTLLETTVIVTAGIGVFSILQNKN